MSVFFSGTSNIELIEKNKLAFPPEFRSKTRLTYYSSLFNSVEINSTFYKLPLPATLEKWTKEVPDDFRFTLKVWREITHGQGLAFPKEDIRKFMSIADRIGDKKGALLIQLPASTHGLHTGELERLLEEIKKSDPAKGWQIAVEFRHQSWHEPAVYSLLHSYDATLVWHDRPVMDQDKWDDRGSFVYLRFHGPNGDYRGSYTDKFLHNKARHILDWLAAGKNVYAYFNNTMEGDAPRNLITLNKITAEPDQS